MEPAPAAKDLDPLEPPLSRRDLIEEVLIVLSLSLLYAALVALLNLLSAPVKRSVAVATFPGAAPQFPFLKQLLDILFSLAPVWLVFHFVRRSGQRARIIGFDAERPVFDVTAAVVLSVAVAGVGFAVYRAAIALNVNRFVVPVPPEHHWWTFPILVLGAFQFGLLEETVVCGYLVTRLQQLRLSAPAAVVVAAVLRGSYHLYQGWGGFTANLALGLFFGALFVRWRRTWPLVIAHGLVDTAAGVAFIANHHKLPTGVGLPIAAAVVGAAAGAVALFGRFGRPEPASLPAS